MRKVTCTLVFLSLTYSLALAIPGDSPTKPSALVVPANSNAEKEGTQIPALMHSSNPLEMQITVLLDQEREQLAELESLFHQAADEQTALEIQTRIREVKIGTELSLLNLQLEAATARGDEVLASNLEKAIETITSPAPTPIFRERDRSDNHRK